MTLQGLAVRDFLRPAHDESSMQLLVTPLPRLCPDDLAQKAYQCIMRIGIYDQCIKEGRHVQDKESRRIFTPDELKNIKRQAINGFMAEQNVNKWLIAARDLAHARKLFESIDKMHTFLCAASPLTSFRDAGAFYLRHNNGGLFFEGDKGREPLVYNGPDQKTPPRSEILYSARDRVRHAVAYGVASSYFDTDLDVFPTHHFVKYIREPLCMMLGLETDRGEDIIRIESKAGKVTTMFFPVLQDNVVLQFPQVQSASALYAQDVLVKRGSDVVYSGEFTQDVFSEYIFGPLYRYALDANGPIATEKSRMAAEKMMAAVQPGAIKDGAFIARWVPATEYAR